MNTSECDNLNGDGDNQETEVLPLFPLSGPMYAVNSNPLPILTKHTHWQYPTPGTERTPHISEPRYRELYGDLLSRKEDERIFAVPFCHPMHSAVFAAHALVYQLTGVQEVADETNGKWQYICQHRVLHRPIRIHRILNPKVYASEETYLKAKISWCGSADGNLESSEIKGVIEKDIQTALDRAVEVGVLTAFAADESKAILNQGCNKKTIWLFLRIWLTSLQQRLLRLELKISGQAKMALRKDLESVYDNDNERLRQRSRDILKHLQIDRREELLQLKLDMTLCIPRVLQACTTYEKWQVILDFMQNATDVAAWSKNAPSAALLQQD